jgi:hypothetical protein
MQRTMKNGEKYEHSFCMRETRIINDVRDLMCREYMLGCHEMLNYTFRVPCANELHFSQP